jgi:hypothetical protein
MFANSFYQKCYYCYYIYKSYSYRKRTSNRVSTLYLCYTFTGKAIFVNW